MKSVEVLKRTIVNKAKKTLPLVAATGLAIAASGCTAQLSFSDCNTDPQAKHQSLVFTNNQSLIYARSISLGGVIFTMDSPNQIDLKGKTQELDIIKENEHYGLNDTSNKRHYDINILPRDLNTRIMSIDATCPPKE